jgi:hypothetical protein
MMTDVLVAHSTEVEKRIFTRRPYLHVALSILAFIGVETILLKTVPVELLDDVSGKTYLVVDHRGILVSLFWLPNGLFRKVNLLSILGLDFIFCLKQLFLCRCFLLRPIWQAVVM